MDPGAFADPRVIALASADFILVKLPAEEHEELALGYGLSALPATVILGPEGGVVTSLRVMSTPRPSRLCSYPPSRGRADLASGPP